MDILRKRNRQT